jgi:hypothetical protein
MEGGGSTSTLSLADIGDFRKVEETLTTTKASLFSTLLVLLSARVGNVGGTSLNEVFTQFGLESVIALVTLLTIVLQFARYMYWVVYGAYGKPWSPFIFVCIAIALQLLLDAALKYGLFGFIPKGKNEMVDAVRKYYFETDMMVFAGHSVLIGMTALIAMVLHETSDLQSYILMTVTVFGIVLALSGVAPKPAPPPAPPKKAPEMKDVRQYY